MDDTSSVEVVDGRGDDLDKLRRIVFEIRSFRANSVKQLSSRAEIRDEIHCLALCRQLTFIEGVEHDSRLF